MPKLITVGVTWSAFLLALVAGPGVAPTRARCNGADCPVPVSGSYTSEDRAFAEAMAVANCQANCSEDACQNIVAQNPGYRCSGTLCKESWSANCVFNSDVFVASGPGAGLWTAFAYGECPCTTCGGDDDDWPAVVGPRIELTLMEKIQQRVRQIFGLPDPRSPKSKRIGGQ